MRPGSGALLLTMICSVSGMWRLSGIVDASERMVPEPKFFQWERGIKTGAGQGTRSCALLDASVYAHAAPELADVRLFVSGPPIAEVPYALTMSETAPLGDEAKVLNLGTRNSHVEFDLAMPARAYTDVILGLEGEDFLATAKVTGLRTLADAAETRGGERGVGTELGVFTLFDLSGQRLGRNTTLALGESSFPYLHVELAVISSAGGVAKVKAAMARGGHVPPSREAQTVYQVVATTKMEQRGRDSIAVFDVPAHVPVERVSFELAAQDRTNFSRSVRIRAKAAGEDSAGGEEIAGEISKVRLTEAGQEIRQSTLDVPATLGSSAQTSAKVEVAIENGDDRPLAIRAVKLEMRERKLCFDVPAEPLNMFYGNAKLEAPVYDYSRTFTPGGTAQVAHLGEERWNSGYTAREETKRSVTERHPEIVWLALLGVVSVLGVVAFRSAKHRGW